jgi:CubicO group peptidase (beta-lactamase class C family)
MLGSGLNRREFVAAAVCAATAGTVAPWFVGTGAASAAAAAANPGRVPAPLAAFIAAYMPAMNAPGLTLSFADAHGMATTAAFGYVDLAAKTPVTTGHLFEIGSISKSFVALTILQLQDEGRLAVHDPILQHLPWLPIETPYGEVLIHHLLTHTSGLPDDPPLFPFEPGGRALQSFTPGAQFHYSNWGFDVLGHLIAALDGRSWPEAVTHRWLAPLGMAATIATIGGAAAPRLAQSYVPLYDDRPYPRHGPLAIAGPMSFELASGSIASTPADMARYLRMLIDGGAGPSGRLVSEAGFKAFTTPFIAAEEFGPGASYGYGIAVDMLDGHKRLRHTGGMVSFMSALHVDLDAGIGAFASINAQLGYRPNPVAQYALRTLRAIAEAKPVPAPPAPDGDAVLEDPGAYVGIYTAPDGRRLEIEAQPRSLVLIADGERLPLQHLGGDQFLADHPRFALYALQFGRETAALPAPAAQPASAAQPAPADARAPAAAAVTELGIGPDWFANARHAGPIVATPRPALAAYPGLYHSQDPWVGSARVVIRRGRLWLNGTTPLEPIGDHLFRFADEPQSPETAEFRAIVAGIAQVLVVDGGVLRRMPES